MSFIGSTILIASILEAFPALTLPSRCCKVLQILNPHSLTHTSTLSFLFLLAFVEAPVSKHSEGFCYSSALSLQQWKTSNSCTRLLGPHKSDWLSFILYKHKGTVESSTLLMVKVQASEVHRHEWKPQSSPPSNVLLCKLHPCVLASLLSFLCLG